MEDYTFTILIVLEHLEIDSQALFDRAIEYSNQHYTQAEYFSDDLDKTIYEFETKLGTDAKIAIAIGVVGLSLFIIGGVVYLISKFNL